MICIKLLAFALFINISFTLHSAQATYLNTTLELVAIIHRHGQRTPEYTWKNDPYKNQKKYWPEGWGELLPEGKRQMFKLGNTFRHRYMDFISEYGYDTVMVNSSDLNRCHMSAASLLAGWFPPQGDQIWNTDLLWQPIPIHSVPISQDRIISLRAPCPWFDAEKEKVLKKITANKTKEEKNLFQYLTNHMGENVSDFHQVEVYYTTLLVEKLVGLKLPRWSNKVFPDKMKRMASKSITVYTWTKEMQKLYGGPLIKEILNQFKLKSSDQNNKRKVFLYSGSDTTIVDVWRALQFTERIIPYFGSALLFELHKSEKDGFFVKLLYMNHTNIAEPYELDIPNCQRPCSLTKLMKVTEYVRSVDWDKDCLLP